MHSSAPTTDPKSNPHSPNLAPRGPDWWLMMKAFWKKGRAIASFAPSSRFMARRLVDGIDFDAARCIVEFGAGTGPITAELIRRVKPHTKLLVIELDPDLCGRLKTRFPQVDVVQGDACHFDKLLAERGLNQVDHICSGLPLPSFPTPLRDAILDTSARMLNAGGTFRQLTVMPLIYYRMYRRYFEDVRFHFVPLNMPPGGVYVCRGYRDLIAP